MTAMTDLGGRPVQPGAPKGIGPGTLFGAVADAIYASKLRSKSTVRYLF